MSLLDFDNDDAGINVTTTTDAGFYGNTASIDDPFGFDAFGSSSAGSVKTKSGSADVAKAGNPFDDFDPFGGFGDNSSVVTVTTTSNFSTTSSFSKPAATNQFAFDDDFSNNNPTTVVTETNTHHWGGDDDFHKGGSTLEEPNGGDDVIHDDVIHDHRQASPEEELTEVSGATKESSAFAGDAFWTINSSSSEQQHGTSSHSYIATPYFDITMPADNSLDDFYGKTAPADVVEDSISTKETENVVLTSLHSDIGLTNGKDVPVSPETFDFGLSGNDEMSEESRHPTGLKTNGQPDISDSVIPATTSIHTDSLDSFAGSVDLNGKNTKGSNSGWSVLETNYEKEIEVRIPEKTEDRVDMRMTSHSEPDEKIPDFQKSPPQDFPVIPVTNHRDVPTADHSHMTSERETVSNESYSFDQDHSWKRDHPMAEKDNADDFEYHFKAQPADNRRHDINSHRGHEDNSLADYFSADNRGRISIEEIRQRSYEDMEPLRSASSHDRNQKEQKTTADNKTPSVYVLGGASDSTCKVCSMRVYEMEKITADLQVYHKTCFRCTHCSRILSLGNFSTNEGRLYCKPHFMEIFKTKGNYKEGFAAAERRREQGDRHDVSDPEDQQCLNGRSRHSSEENGPSRMRHSSSGREDDYDEADDGAYLQEEIPVVQIKSVRSMFEKMSQDKSPAAGQPKKATNTSQAPQSAGKGQWKQPEQVRRDSLRSEGEREERERKGSVGDKEVVQSSTVCIVEEELPPPSFTKSMLAKFRMMEDVSGGAKPAPPNYGKPSSSKQPSFSHSGSTGRHQNLGNRLSSGSSESNRREDDENETPMTSSRQHSSAEEQTDELPQAGHAKSLLAQWRNIEEQSKRGRNRELKKTSTSARRSQSMSRVETVQRASVYRNIDLGSPRSKQAEDVGRSGYYSDQEASEDDAPVSMPTKQNLAKFKELEGGKSVHETDGSHTAKRKFKWEVKEAVPLNRGGIIVHGDIPKRPTTENADVIRGSEDMADNEDDDYDGGLKRNGVDSRREYDADSEDVVHQSVLTVFNEDELPAPATTRTLLQHFKSMEDVTKAPPLPRPSPSEAAREARPKSRLAASGGVHSDSNYDDGYRNQKRQSIHSDSEDIQNADAAKELDAYDGEELPVQGTTKSLLAKFQSFQTKN